MSNSKIEVGYVFKFDCNNTVPRLKGTLEAGETVSARVSREIKPHPESMTTWYDLEIPTVVYEAFTVRLSAPEIRDMGGELDFLASAPVIADKILAASIRGDHEEVVSIWSWVGSAGEPGQSALIEMHKKVKNAIVEAVVRTRPNFEEWARKATERKLHSLGIIENFDEVTAVSFWVNTHTGQRHETATILAEARNIIDELGVSIFE
jgi:hypothetical protein